jgi:hypothetical protein
MTLAISTSIFGVVAGERKYIVLDEKVSVIVLGFSTTGSKFVSIVHRARMVSTGDNGIRLVQASEE